MIYANKFLRIRRTHMANEKIYGMLFNKVFPMLIAKAERKGRKNYLIGKV